MTLNVLLVEDNPGDVRLTLETFRDANKSVRLHLAANGVEAMAFLRREGTHALAPRPVLILLDLTIPIVILTTSDTESDITRSYQLQANCYLTKPVRLEEFENLVRSVNEFWLTRVKLMNVASS
jgi:two-component system, chemotaxis family, response regulator Rcp1